MSRRTKSRQAKVILLNDLRVARKLRDYREKLKRGITYNRRAIGKLYSTGMLFTKSGTRAGRDLLTAHEHLLRVVSLLDRMEHMGDVPAPQSEREVGAVFAELDTLLAQTETLNDRTGEVLSALKKD
ncbi:MAG: hypothetical protein K1X64_13945 [Myxococcaceae bacterium]|nr:hypothetical protein [Myxococcaceae bacterium]